MLVYIILLFIVVCVFAYFFAFEHCRYKTAKMLADGLGGRAVFKLGRSYMERYFEGAEERAWILPDVTMPWGSFLSKFLPPSCLLFLRREKAPDFRFLIEPKGCRLSQTLFMSALKEVDFNIPRLDESLTLWTNNPDETHRYFSAPEKQQALNNLFLAGFSQLKGDQGTIEAHISVEDVNPNTTDLYFRYLRVI